MDRASTQDQLHLLSIIPERMVYDARENIALIFNNALPSGSYNIEFHGRQREKMQVKAKRVNPFTLIVQAPVYYPTEKVRVCVRHVTHEGMKSLGSLPFQFISRGNLMAGLLQDCTDPVTFMCEALGISPSDMVALDKALTASFKTNMPQGFQLLGLRNEDIQHVTSNSVYPTLLHFASAFGLYHFVKDCLCHCSGFIEAVKIPNSTGKRPSEIAYEGQFMNIYQLLCSAEENGQEIYEQMSENYEEDPYYTSCQRYINLHLWRNNDEPHPEDDDTDPDGYFTTTRTDCAPEDIYTDMESGRDDGYTTTTRLETEGDEIYADMESGADHYDTCGHELYADMECGTERGDFYTDVKRTESIGHGEEYNEEDMYMNEGELYKNEGPNQPSHYETPSNLPVSSMYPDARSISVSLKSRSDYVPPKVCQAAPAVPSRVKEKKALIPPTAPKRPSSIASNFSVHSVASIDSGIEPDSNKDDEDENHFMSRRELLDKIEREASEASYPPPPPPTDYDKGPPTKPRGGPRPPAPEVNGRGSDTISRPPAPPPSQLRGVPTPIAQLVGHEEEPPAPAPPPRIGSKMPTPAPRSRQTKY